MNMTEQNQQGTCPVVCLQTNIRLRLFLSEWKTQETNTLKPLDDCHRAVIKASNNVQALNDTSVKLSKITTQVTTRRDHISVKQLFHRVTYDVMTQSTRRKWSSKRQIINLPPSDTPSVTKILSSVSMRHVSNIYRASQLEIN